MKKRLLCLAFVMLLLSSCGGQGTNPSSPLPVSKQETELSSAPPSSKEEEAPSALASEILQGEILYSDNSRQNPYEPFFPPPAGQSFLEFPEDYTLPVMICAHSQVFNLSETEISSYQGNSMFHIPAPIPYIAIGDPIQVQIRGEMPDSVAMEDYVLDKDGLPRFTFREISGVSLAFQDGKAAFSLPIHPASTLDSEFTDYQKPGGCIRGLKLICKWGDTEKHYTCVLRTDPWADLPGE